MHLPLPNVQVLSLYTAKHEANSRSRLRTSEITPSRHLDEYYPGGPPVYLTLR
jgi:hypothetical protein